MIPPFVQQIIGVVVRTLIVWIATKFGAKLSDDQLVQITAQVLPVVLVLTWSVWQKYHGRLKLLTALGSNKVMTEHEVETRVNDPATPSPAINTAKSEVPA